MDHRDRYRSGAPDDLAKPVCEGWGTASESEGRRQIGLGRSRVALASLCRCSVEFPRFDPVRQRIEFVCIRQQSRSGFIRGEAPGMVTGAGGTFATLIGLVGQSSRHPGRSICASSGAKRESLWREPVDGANVRLEEHAAPPLQARSDRRGARARYP